MADLVSFPILPTFRDPAGSIEIRRDGAYRRIRAPFDAEILSFLSLPLASELVADGRLVASEVVTPRAETLVLRHPRVSFPSYPWEWTPALWLAAAELTLNLCSDLLKEGWLLKDATPLNVLFEGSRPVFVDVLSIQRAALDRAIWYPYGQFIRTFLLPMVAYSQLGWPLQVALTRRDGYEPEEIFGALSWPARLRQPALSAVTLPTLLSRRAASNAEGVADRTVRDPELAREVLLRTLRTLLTRMRQATPRPTASAWSDYADTATHYTETDHTRKRTFVAEALATARPTRVLDAGCNTGVYSMLAAEAGAEVVSIDTDLQAIDRLCAKLKGSGKNILALCVDLAQPTPASGWENRETSPFLSRCAGHFDTVMMLAVLHHLLLSSQVPMDRIAALCGNLTTRHLIVEWVPPTDVKFKELLRGREEIYAHVTEAAFREAFAKHFIIAKELTLFNGRILLHLEKR
jgi:SAM-dependent methyltransferase